MKRSHEGLPVLGGINFTAEAKMIFKPERSFQHIHGHLRQLLIQEKRLPPFPGGFKFGKPSWLAPLLAKVEFTARDHMQKWGLIQLLIFAKKYDKMLLHWDALGALVELWHPQTHTFIFSSFEASVLLEEVELFLGLKRLKDASKPVAYAMNIVDTMSFLSKLTGDRLQARNIACSKGIRLSMLAKWAMQAKDKGTGDEPIAQALSLCLAGLLFFPNHDDILDQEHIGTIQGVWKGRSLAQPILAYLYNGLTSACMEKPFFGCAILLDIWLSFHIKMDFEVNDSNDKLKTYDHTPIHEIRHALFFSDTMVIRTRKLKSRDDWRGFFVHLSYSGFTFCSEALANLEFKSRPSQGVDLRLVGSKELVLYNAHRCFLQLGQPRHVIPPPSHYQPIESRSFNTYDDQVNVRTCLELWKISHKNKVTMNFAEENVDLLVKHIMHLRKFRCIEY